MLVVLKDGNKIDFIPQSVADNGFSLILKTYLNKKVWYGK